MIARYLSYTLLWMAAFAVILFVGAGDWRWPEAWAFLAEYTLLTGAVVIWLARYDPALLRERFTGPVHRDQAAWDRVFLLCVMVVFVAWLVLIAFDARRFAWSHVPRAIKALGAVAFAGSMFITWLTFRANTFAVPQVRAQADRDQHVISDGPYRFVRHPMYTGGLLFFVGMPLMLGSWCGLLVVPIIVSALAARILGEERMLRRELAGYDAYATQVRWRLLPGLW